MYLSNKSNQVCPQKVTDPDLILEILSKRWIRTAKTNKWNHQANYKIQTLHKNHNSHKEKALSLFQQKKQINLNCTNPKQYKRKVHLRVKQI